MPKSLPKAVKKSPQTASPLARRLAAIGGSAAFAYVTIFLLQVKAVWGIWQWRDITDGDTTEYFVDAFRWYSQGRGRLVWSPLYTWFYGLFLHVSQDAFVVTTLHRLAIVFILAFLVLALMRRLLPPAYAWLATAWWVILPIGFNSLYEVHLFGVIPLLLAPLAVLWLPGRWGRGCCAAILLLDALLVRNEFLAAAFLFAAGCVVWEFRTRSKTEKGSMRGYGIPIAAMCCIVLFFYLHSTKPAKITLSASLASKHTGNVCEVYAFGYQQRHTDWQKSPWLECRDLMQRNFGVPQPSLLQAMWRNPPAILEHFSWNLSLTPNGMQVLLLNVMSGDINPDYAPVTTYRPLAVPASLILIAVVLVGSYFLWRDWSHWWNTLLKDKAWAWFAMLCISCVTPVIILTQRPRPSYLLAFGIFVRAAIGVCTLAILRRVTRLPQAGALGPFVVVLLIAVAPSYFLLRHFPRPLLDRYRAIAPFRDRFESPDVVFSTDSWPNELHNYIAPAARHKDVFLGELQRQVTPEKPLRQVLEQNHVTLLFADNNMLADPAIRDFVSHADANGWHVIGSSADPAWPWSLLAKIPSK